MSTGDGQSRDEASRQDSTRDAGAGQDRLGELGRRLDQANRRRDERTAERPATPSSGGGSSLGHALRMSSEFVGGVIVGGGIGWTIDRSFGTSPWGIIVFFLLGFAAGILNVMRAAGMVGRPPRSGGGA